MDKKLFNSILLIITYTAILIAVLSRLDVIGHGLLSFGNVLRPLALGFALAFVLNRPCQFFLRLYRRPFGRMPGVARTLAVLSAYLCLFLAVFAVASFIVPHLVTSIQNFVGGLEGNIGNLQSWVNHLLEQLHLKGLDLSGLNSGLQNLFQRLLALLEDIGPVLLSLAGSLISAVVTGVLALVFSIYMLAGRDTLLRQFKKLFRAYLPPKVYAPLSKVLRLTTDTFTNFVSGQLLEACILGGLCGIGMLFIQADYAPLIGVIIGISALIPVLGAYVGTVVSALLLLLVSPFKALVFLIFLVILQQVEGNVIYPKVVGTSIGLPGIWVLAAVTIGSGLFGLMGTLLSVPVTSVIYTLLRRDVRRRLPRSGVDANTNS